MTNKDEENRRDAVLKRMMSMPPETAKETATKLRRKKRVENTNKNKGR